MHGCRTSVVIIFGYNTPSKIDCIHIPALLDLCKPIKQHMHINTFRAVKVIIKQIYTVDSFI